MKSSTQIKFQLEDFEKIHLYCDSDCPLGRLYDFSCVLQSSVLQKMKELQVSKPQTEEEANV